MMEVTLRSGNGCETATGSRPTVLRAVLPCKGSWRLNERVVDGVERLVILALFGWLAARMLLAYQTNGGLTNLIFLLSEGLVALFTLLRRQAVTISKRPSEWLLAFGAGYSVLLVAPVPAKAWLPPAISATIVLMGLIIQLHAKISLGRRFGVIPAHRGIALAGPYRFVRHPMYAGYLLSHVGFLSANFVLWNVLLYATCYALQIPRLLAEERLLSTDPAYRAYQATVRFRLVPGVF